MFLLSLKGGSMKEPYTEIKKAYYKLLDCYNKLGPVTWWQLIALVIIAGIIRLIK